MRPYLLAYAQPGDLIDDVYVITNRQLSTTSTGKYFIKAFVGDRSGQITARMWNAGREDFLRLPESGFVFIKGRIENYQNNLQLIIDDYKECTEADYDIADLLPHTPRDIPSMEARLRELCDSIANRHLAAIVDTFTADDALMARFRRSPAAMSFHHAYLGGLLEHTLNAMEVADAIVKFYPGISRDLVLAGIFLHDIAKSWELSFDCAFGYTDGGQLVGHIVKSAMWVEERSKVAAERLGEPIPRPLIDVLQHIILSHHGLPEHGAVKVPSTPEAIMVHIVENMDAKLMMALQACRGEDNAAGGNWTEFMKAFGVKMFRPDVAPADADVIEPPAQPAPTQRPSTAPAAPATPAARTTPPAPPAPAVERPAARTPAVPPTPPAPDPAEFNNPLFKIEPARRR